MKNRKEKNKRKTHVTISKGQTYMWLELQEKKNEDGAMKIFGEIMAENFPNLGEDKNIHV